MANPVMTETGSITNWLNELQIGKADAAQAIWNRFYSRVVRLASNQLGNRTDRAIDGEDIAQSVFRNIYAAVRQGNQMDIENRQDLWKLLMVSTLNRVRSHYRKSSAQKRPVYADGEPISKTSSIVDALGGPEDQAQFADILNRLLLKLDQEDPTGELRQIALLKLDEHSATEIATRLKRRKSHVLQSIRLIRILWEESGLL